MSKEIIQENINLMNKERYEQEAKKYENIMPNLSKALRSADLQNSCADIEMFDGWVRCKTSLPDDGEDVLVTDGREVWIGDYNSKRSARDGKWGLVYNGSTPFDSTGIIAWMFKPTVLPGLFDRDKIKFICASDSDSFNYIPKQVTQFEIEMSNEDIDSWDTIEECQKECDKLNSL